MKKKTTLKKFMFLPVTACDAIKEELEAMALKGWKLKRMGVRYEFERIEPKKLIYTVDFFPKASVYDTEPSGGTLSYIECCRQAGWELVASNGTMHIFVSENENAIPIHTDEKLRLEAVEKSMLKTYWSSWFLIPLYFVFSIIMQLFSFQSLVTSNMNLCCLIIYVGMLLFCLSDFFGFLHWKVKNQKRVKNGEKIQFVGSKTSRKIFAVRTSFVIILFLFIPLIFSVVSRNWFCATITVLALFSTVLYTFADALVERFKVPKGAYVFITFVAVILVYVISFFALLKFDDIFNNDTDKPSDNFSFAANPNYTYNIYLDKSILASEEEVMVERDDEFDFRYITFKSNSQFIIKKYYNKHYKTGYTRLPQENESWNAKEVLISDEWNNLIVVYDNAIIHFNGLTDFTAEQKNEVSEKLTKPVDGFLPSLSASHQK